MHIGLRHFYGQRQPAINSPTLTSSSLAYAIAAPTNAGTHNISQMLTIDMPVEWISKQTDTSPDMIRRRYGKWIDDAADTIKQAESA